MSNIFGDYDVDQIPDDPNFVAENIYYCVCTESRFHTTEERVQLVVKWNIDEPDSDYHGKPLSKWYTVQYPGRNIDQLDGKEKQSLTWSKWGLRRAFDLSESELKAITPEDLIGRYSYVTVKNIEGTGEHAGKTFTNIKDTVSKRLHEEEQGPANDTSEFGL